MHSFQAFLSKEFRELLRTRRILVFFIAIGFFALLDPVMLRVLPEILKAQMGGPEGNFPLEAMGITLSQAAALKNFSGDLFELSTLVVVLAMMNLAAGERSQKTLILPRMAGLGPTGAVWAKLLVNGTALAVLTAGGFATAYVYAGLIFPAGEKLEFGPVMLAGLFHGLHFIYLTSLVLFFGSLTGKGALTAVFTMGTAYGGAALSALLPNISDHLPYAVMERATAFSGFGEATSGIFILLGTTLLLCFLSGSILRRKIV
ncbi:MAG TPA: hypothetical protein DD727_04260 [Clostridiales bacterium]|nr:hypothetical protein [Clostridiales bacterium]